MDDLNKKTRSALTRAELPGMSLIEHLEELRKRLIHSAIYLAISSSSLTPSTSAYMGSFRPQILRCNDQN